jgi:hypothetical protein
MPRLDRKILTSERYFWFIFENYHLLESKYTNEERCGGAKPKFKDGKIYISQSKEPKIDSGRFSPRFWPRVGRPAGEPLLAALRH